MSTNDAPSPRPGDVVRAKRAGWDEVLTPEQEFDLEPYAEKGYESDDLEGELQIHTINSPIVGKITVYLVGGQEADPKTITDLAGNVLRPTRRRPRSGPA